MEDKKQYFDAEAYSSVLRNNLTNSMAMTVNNSGLSGQEGLEQTITSLTDIISGVVKKKFYELNGQKLSDFCKIEVGKGAYQTNLMQYAISYTGNAGKAGLINPTANGVNKDANVSIQIGSLSMPNNFWRFAYEVSNELIKMGAKNPETFSIVEEHENARKKVYDLMLQDAWFNGLGDGKSFGLLNQPNVAINTSLMKAELSKMTDDQFRAFIAELPDAYNSNTNYAINFNRLMMPSSEYFSLTQPFGQYGLNRLQVLEDAMKRVTGGDFKIVHSTYNTGASAQGGKKGRYVIYNDDADNLCAYMPVPYTPMPLFPQGSLDLVSQAHAQFVTPFLKRTTSMVYADVQ